MRLRSLGHRTDVMLHGLCAEVRFARDHVAVRTPDNPSFYWGNYLIFDRPPVPGDLERWTAVFRAEIGGPPLHRHLAFSWDVPDGVPGELGPFLTAGFVRDDLVVMTASADAIALASTDTAPVRELVGDADWAAWIALGRIQNAALPDGEREPEQGFADYITGRAAMIQRMLSRGTGRWFGAFVDGQLVSSAGLFTEDGLGRFQHVDTHPEHRRRGHARAVLGHAARVGRETLGAETLVIVADDAYFAKDLYAGLGFTPVERLVELTRRPDTE